jgi:hypothetical protein
MSETRSESYESVVYHRDTLLRLFEHSEDVVIEERSRNIIVSAQRDNLVTVNQRMAAQIQGFRIDNVRLQEQNRRQVKTIVEQDKAMEQYHAGVEVLHSEKDAALANAQVRIKYLQEELVRVAAIKLKPRGFLDFVAVKGRDYSLKPRRVAVDVHMPNELPTTYEFGNPKEVHLTF